jgi:2-C-methyl-D-erythritol 4-phosphate cytidylyltransferase
MGQFAVILPAAGRSTRFGDSRQKKVYADLDGRAVWLRAVEAFVNRPDVAQIILAIAPEDRELLERRYRANVAFLGIRVIDGGAERYETVAKALEALDPACDCVAVHDAARPCVTPDLIDAVFAAAREHGAALPGLAVTDTLKRVGPDHNAAETVPRAGLVAVQTPQAFRRDLLERAYAHRATLAAPITDDAQLVEALGHTCRIVPGSPFNLKITTPDDLRLASAILRVLPTKKREGPAHPFADEQAMWGET